MFEIELFGTGRASYGGQTLAGFPGQQWHRLLCYLVLNRARPHNRERLAAVFWSEHPTATSRAYLRNALWRLRQALQELGMPVDEFLCVHDDTIQFLAADLCEIDVEAFSAAVEGCRGVPGEQLSAAQVACLEQAVNLYTGDLLEGIYDDWCLFDRERLRLSRLKALYKLLTFHEQNGTYGRGLEIGSQLLELDPTREKVHRHLMRLYWLQGERSEALAQYKCCVQILREELDIAPTPKTTLLYEQMAHNRFDPERWRIRPDEMPEPVKQNDALQPFVEYVLRRLHHLRAIHEETTVELDHIEQLIARVLLTTR